MLLESIFKDLRNIIKSITIKYESKAKQFETLETIKAWDTYYLAVNKYDKFETYPSFTIDVILDSGITSDYKLAQSYAQDKYLIPDNYRYNVLEAQRRYIISNFEEKNNYYRMLIGLPDVEDTNFIYVDESLAKELGIDPSKPIHELKDEEILLLDKRGYINQLKALYPDKKYLNYLGINKIDLMTAREAKNFSILSITKELSEDFYQEFMNTYAMCREYYMSVIYNKDYGSRFDLYDNFIAMMIMVMTIQRIIVNTFKYGINRDFYDLNSIQLLFNAYNVPFIEKLPLEYQRAIARNLNNLLRYKSTDKVLYDICSILGFERANIFRYYLIKEHKLDENEKPIFIYKEETDENGNTILVEDKEKMYSLYFQTVELRERNVALALSNSNNRIDYNQVVLDDVFWWEEDEELKKVIYESEFNYVETKFLGLNVMYKMTEMLFEVIYVFRMILDKKEEVKDITIELPKIFSNNKKISLFDTVVLLCALVAKKNNMVGNIIHTPSKTLSVLGFNFRADFEAIREEIRNNPHLDSKILDYIMDMNIMNAKDINNLFKNIRELNDFLVERMARTQNLEQYRAYKKLYDTLMITDHMESLFRKSDGEVAETFLEYLDDHDPLIAEFVRNVDIDQISEYVEHIITRFNALITELKYLYIIYDSNNVILNAIVTLIRFFKSYTVDLAPLNVLYLMDSRYYNMIKMLHDVKNMEKILGINETGMLMNYKTNLKYTASLSKKEMINLLNTLLAYTTISEEERPVLREKWDKNTLVTMLINLGKPIVMDLMGALKTISVKHNTEVYDKINQFGNIHYSLKKIKSDQEINSMYKEFFIHYVLPKYSDSIASYLSSYSLKDAIVLKQLFKYEVSFIPKDKILENYKEKISCIEKQMSMGSVYSKYSDTAMIESNNTLKDRQLITDRIKLIWEE